MLFSTLPFLYAFLPALLIAYWLAAKSPSIQLIILTVFSLVFYAVGEPVYILLMIGLVAADWVFGILCAGGKQSEKPLKKKILLAAAIVVNIGTLAFFKYTNFAIDNINAITGLTIPGINVTMPIGISFFTFQSMSYVIDTYRGVTKVQKSFVKLLLYVSFFPQLIAGPIVRYVDIEDQLENRSWSLNQINDGVFRFATGLAKKVLIADSCLSVIESYSKAAGGPYVAAQWMTVLFFSLQLYFDFSGYSDMAIGLGKMFGFEFPENFDHPFASKSVREYWRRWHMTLGVWFKDYIYIPLGGNRVPKWRKCLNLLVVFLVSGLWHGAAWNFVLWGIYNYILSVFDMLVLDKFKKKLPKTIESVFSHTTLIIATVFGMALFYFETDTFANLGYLFGIGTSGFTDLDITAITCQNLWLLIAGWALSMPLVPFLYKKAVNVFGITPGADRIIKTAVSVILLFLGTAVMASQTFSPFLYFRF